ncbi:MAG: menaquinone biosynthesis protein [Trueperaceae bacterium]
MPEARQKPVLGDGSAQSGPRVERLGVVSYANVSPLHYRLEPWCDEETSVEFVYGVPSELNASLLAGEIDLTLVSSIEFIRQRRRLVALPDFSIATLGPAYSVMLFHWRPWSQLHGARIAVTTESATSVELLRVLLQGHGMKGELIPMAPVLDEMLASCDGALLIGDAALAEGVACRSIDGRAPVVTDLGEAWYRLTRLPFTFAVWASLRDNPPSEALVERLRSARERGLGEISQVAALEAPRSGVPESVMRRYLSNFRYYLEPPDRDGLDEFARRSIPRIDLAQLEYWQL